MKNYKKIVYIILAVLLILTILFILLIHIFNSTPESGQVENNETKNIKYYGD